ncbi:54S ribosomal protein yml6, mitochondrial [Colletotrichum musicola]|uniref:Large ribosomal subunit protein uL4m n=1 Tax=Colletotrichum musicola TaxID=2175873 RepID=A0A8H6NYQ0_9PEZI|nr:54S ribosomal protein yml6, mitochondrial [Colletotrichum musicola]
MAGKGVRSLAEAMRGLSLSQTTCRTANPASLVGSSNFTRSMATEAPMPSITTSAYSEWSPVTTVPVTLHSFPFIEPKSVEAYSAKHLYLPFRRDLLHLAVVYEGDKTRQGTASTKTRWEVRGSHRKIHPQKGTGRARAGTKQSPIRRGGGVAHGPKPRDFSTQLNRKVYDMAWRTALSYRYRRGELIVCEDGMELSLPEEFLTREAGKYDFSGLKKKTIIRPMDPVRAGEYRLKWTSQFLAANEWGRDHGRTLFVTSDMRPQLFKSFSREAAGAHGRCLEVGDVDVKDLLTEGRVVIEREALREMLEAHQSDLVSKIFINGQARQAPTLGERLV